MAAQKKFDEIVKDITINCYDKIVSMDEDMDRAVGVMATGMLHYLLTAALITSQRKTEYKKVCIDIVLPDVRTLASDPKKTLLICIPMSSDRAVISEIVCKINKIQPDRKNVWLILAKDVETDRRSFVLSKECNTFSKIISEIMLFDGVGDNKLKILHI